MKKQSVWLGIGILFVGLVILWSRPWQQQPLTISAITIPHHDLVKPQREAFLAKLAANIRQPETIILVSPNHYEVGIGNIQTDRQVWHTQEGDFQPNAQVLDSIKDIADTEPGSFANEHGIRLVLGDLKHYFPKASIVPLILKRETTPTQISDLERTLNQSCRACLLVSSVDYSHYQPALLAKLHDDLSIRALDDLDESALMKKAEIDSPAALVLMAKWAKDHHTNEFHLDNYTNSGILSRNFDQETTTHIFGWYQTGSKTKPESNQTFSISGPAPTNSTIQSFDQLGERVFWGTDQSIIKGGVNQALGKFLHISSASETSIKLPNEALSILNSIGTLSNGFILSGKFTNEGLMMFALPVKAVGGKPQMVRGKAKSDALAKLYAPFRHFERSTDAGTVLFFPKK